jgi:flagellar motor switch protein FliN/FliY
MVKGIETVKEEVALLWQAVTPEVPTVPEPEPEVREERKAPPPPAVTADYEFPVAATAFERPALPDSVDQAKLDLILDIPLKVTVVLGRTKRPIKDILSLGPGNIVELATLADEPVEVLVNGTLVARGEVVVVNENFGVQITNIITPQERLQHLGSKS